MDKSKRKLRGFTLLELIVVIAIMSVLMAVLIPNIIGMIRSNKITAANDQAQQLYIAAQDYLVDCQLNGMKPKDFKNESSSDEVKYLDFYVSPANALTYNTTNIDSEKADTVTNNMVLGITGRLEGGFKGACLVAFYPDTFTVSYVCFNNARDDSTFCINAVEAKGLDPSNLYTSEYGGGLTLKDQTYAVSKGDSASYTGQCPIPGPTI